MIKGVHTMFYTSKPEELRTFFKEKFNFSFTDVGGGWLIFDLPQADMGCHPDDPANGQPSGMPYISFYTDDIESTIKELKAKGVEFIGGIEDKGYGLAIDFKMPGVEKVELYQPRYKK